MNSETEEFSEAATVSASAERAWGQWDPRRPFLNGLVIQILTIALTAGIVMTLFSSEVMWSVLLLILAAVILSIRHWGGLLLLIVVQADLFVSEDRYAMKMPLMDAMLYSFGILSAVMFLSRQRHILQDFSEIPLFRLLTRKGLADSSEQPGVERELPEAEPQTQHPGLGQGSPGGFVEVSERSLRRLSSALRALSLLAICALAATLLIASAPRGAALAQDLRDAADTDPGMRTASLLLTTIVAILLVVGELTWRQMTPAQAKIFQRSLLLQILFSDLRLIVKQRIRVRQNRFAGSRPGPMPQ
jgi:hypothetical protein